MARTNRIVEGAERRLSRQGQRWTDARASLVESLARSDAPLTVPELCRRAEIPVSSVYRNLAVLEQAGIVHRIPAGEHARYELAEDLSERHHHHLICTDCGRVEDFEASAALERSAVDGLARAARRLGWTVRGHRLDVVGACASCRVD